MGGVPSLGTPVAVAVVGGGPAGLMAAGEAAGAGAAVTLLEAGDRPGRKLLLTGKGRCNLSNTLPLEEFIKGFGANGAFLRNGLHRFFTAELRAFLAARERDPARVAGLLAIEGAQALDGTLGGLDALFSAGVRMAGGASASMTRSAPRKQVLATACAIALFATAANAQQATEQAQQEEQQAQQSQQQAQQPAAAQQESDVSTLETIHVTGIRAAIASAGQNKLESTSIIESISAEDLGKLPDISIADSISRLPGVATQRVAGRSQVIQIRGMSEQFAGTTLNGREQVTTGDNRGVEFDQYPAELISGVDLHKTPDATLIGQGISGTVDLKTIRPLSFGERRFVTSAQGDYNDLGNLTEGGKDKGYRVSAWYVDQFADDTFGIAIGYARLSSPFQEQHYKAWWWANINSWGSWAPAQPGKPADAISLQGAENWVKSRDLTRDGLMAVAEYKPNDTFHSTLDLYYTQFDQDDLMRGVMWSSDPWANGGQVTYTGATTTTVSGGDKLVTGGTLNNVRPVVRNDHDKREDTIFSAGWNNEVTLDAWKLTADLSYSRAETDRVLFETTAGPFIAPTPLASGYS